MLDTGHGSGNTAVGFWNWEWDWDWDREWEWSLLTEHSGDKRNQRNNTGAQAEEQGSQWQPPKV